MAKPRIAKTSQTVPFVDGDGRINPEWLRMLNELTDAVNDIRDNSAIMGSASGNVALQNLLTNLEGKGVIDDQST